MDQDDGRPSEGSGHSNGFLVIIKAFPAPGMAHFAEGPRIMVLLFTMTIGLVTLTIHSPGTIASR